MRKASAWRAADGRLMPIVALLAAFVLFAVPASAARANDRTPVPAGAISVRPSAYDFGNVYSGRGTDWHRIVVLNRTDREVTIHAVSTTMPDQFEIDGGTCVRAPIPAGGACSYAARFYSRRLGRVYGSTVFDASDSIPATQLTARGTGRVGLCHSVAPAHSRRDPRNPLGIATHDRGSADPLTGAKFFVDRTEGLAVPYISRFRRQGRLHEARLLEKIASQPETKRFSRFTRSGAYRSVRQFLCRRRVQDPDATPTATVYRLEHEHCGNYSGDPPREERAYRRWIDDFARGVGTERIILFYEFDALITSPCLNSHGLATRIRELRYGVRKLSKLKHAVVYLDAGAADALPYHRTAQLLSRVGLRHIQGFFLNSTHFDTTRNEIAYGQKISRLVRGKHFIISTAVNGNGPLRPRNRVGRGNEVLCNPPGRALGTPPTTHTGNRLMDAFVWIGNPGRSGGRCHPGDARNGYFDVRYALSLAAHAHF